MEDVERILNQGHTLMTPSGCLEPGLPTVDLVLVGTEYKLSRPLCQWYQESRSLDFPAD